MLSLFQKYLLPVGPTQTSFINMCGFQWGKYNGLHSQGFTT